MQPSSLMSILILIIKDNLLTYHDLNDKIQLYYFNIYIEGDDVNEKANRKEIIVFCTYNTVYVTYY